MVPEMLVSFNHLIQLMAPEDYINFSHSESFNSYNWFTVPIYSHFFSSIRRM